MYLTGKLNLCKGHGQSFNVRQLYLSKLAVTSRELFCLAEGAKIKQKKNGVTFTAANDVVLPLSFSTRLCIPL